MISLKLSKSEAKAELDYDEGSGPAYPYGLTIYLDTDTLKKLGITDMPDVGTDLTLNAKVTVTGTSVRKQQGGDDCKCMDLQITDMELASAARKATESVLYG